MPKDILLSWTNFSILITIDFLGLALISQKYVIKLRKKFFQVKALKKYFSCQIKWLNIFVVGSFSYRQLICHISKSY